MIPTQVPLPSEPADVGALVEATMRTFSATLWACFPLTFAPSLIGLIPALTMPDPEANPLAALEWFQRPSVWAMYLALTVVSVLCINATVYRMGMLGRGHDASLVQSIERGLQRLLPGLGAWFLYVFLIMATMMLWVVAIVAGTAIEPRVGGAIGGLLGIWLLALPTWASVAFGFFVFSIVLERQGAIASLRRSTQLVRSNWWRTSLVVGLAMLIYMVGIMFVALIAAAVAALLVWFGQGTEALGGTGWLIGTQLLLAPFAALGQQLMIASGLAMFNDLVLRKTSAA